MFPVHLRRLLVEWGDHMPRLGVGVDIGRSAVRVVALRSHQGGVELVGLASAPADTGAMSVPILRSTVRRACRAASWWPRRVALAVPSGAVLTRAVQVVPGADAEEVADAVERAARQLPIGQTDPSLAWEALAADSVLMVAARRDAVLARHDLAVRAGLGAACIDVDILASLSTVDPSLAAPGAGDLRVLADAGTDSLRVAAWAPGRAPVLRLLPLPESCTTDDLADLAVEALRGLGTESATQPAVVQLAGGRALADGVPLTLSARTGLCFQLTEPFAGLLDPGGLAVMPAGAAALWPCAVGLARRALA